MFRLTEISLVPKTSGLKLISGKLYFALHRGGLMLYSLTRHVKMELNNIDINIVPVRHKSVDVMAVNGYIKEIVFRHLYQEQDDA